MTALATTPLAKVTSVKDLLFNAQAAQQLSMVAQSEMRPDRMLRVMANAARSTPKLYDCDPMSLLGAMMTCASLGLEPNTNLGHAYLIPFENKRKKIVEVQLIIGYRGMIDLAQRSGQVKSIYADVVFDDDELWSYEYGSNQHLRHKVGPRKGQPTHAYAYVKLTDGEAFVVLPWEEVMSIRDESQVYKAAVRFGDKSNPWIKHVNRMAAKTAIRRIFNYLPISIERRQVVDQVLSIEDTETMDYAGFALNPTEFGPAEAGDVIEADDGADVVDADEPSKREPDREPEPRTVDRVMEREPEHRSDAGDPEDSPSPGHAAVQIALTILNDLAEAPPDGVEAIVQLHAEYLERFEVEQPAISEAIGTAMKDRKRGLEINPDKITLRVAKNG
ncbi:MAG: recombinase RecT [Pseudomonadota bacterium]